MLHHLYLTVCRRESHKAKEDYQRLDYNIINSGYTAKQIREVNTKYRTAYTRWEACNTLVCEFENSYGIEERWTPQMQSYKDAQVLLSERKYRRALDELERLVVQRLFEMTKLGMSGVGRRVFRINLTYSNHSILLGYRLRDKIGRSLKTRSDAIATALRNYNQAALILNPPRPPLTWASVVQATSLADFDLLRNSRADIRSQPWTEASRREAMNLYFGIKRAHEEIDRLNVEIKRLLTFMVDDHIDFYHAVGRTVMEDPFLAAELSREYEKRNELHFQLARRLGKVGQLDGFTGTLDLGKRIGRDSRDTGIPLPAWFSLLKDPKDRISSGTQGTGGDESEEESGDVEQDSDIMVQLVDTLSV